MSARIPIKTLLITGQNSHNWEVIHVVLKQILENSDRFTVDLAISLAKEQDMSGGWEKRNEDSKPYVYWKNDRLVKDSSADPTVDDNIAMQCTGFRLLDHGKRDAVFDAACRVEVFQFADKSRFQSVYPVEVGKLQQGRVADKVGQFCCNMHSNKE